MTPCEGEDHGADTRCSKIARMIIILCQIDEGMSNIGHVYSKLETSAHMQEATGVLEHG